MPISIIRAFLTTLLIILPVTSFAADLYVRDGGTGNCSDWTNACDQLTTAEAAASRGDTIYVADGSYGGITFDVAESGTSIVTIKKATVAAHGTDTGWQDAYGDGQATIGLITINTGYLTIDGVTRNATNWKDSTSYGFVLNGGVSDSNAVYTGNTENPSNVTVAYCYIPGAGTSTLGNRLIYAVYWGAGTHIHHNLLSQAGQNHIRFGATSNVTVEYNYFDTNYSEADAHGESIQTTSGADNGVVRYNYFENTAGTGCIVLNSVQDWKIYGNVFLDIASASNGIIGVTSGETADNVLVYNNTFADSPTTFGCVAGGTCTNWDFQNNIIVGATTGPTFSDGFTVNSYNASDSSSFGTNFQTISTGVFVGYSENNFRLSSATTAGATLTGYAADLLGNTRGADGTWDRGAYEFGVTGESVNQTSTPSSIAGSWK